MVTNDKLHVKKPRYEHSSADSQATKGREEKEKNQRRIREKNSIAQVTHKKKQEQLLENKDFFYYFYFLI